MTINRVLAVPPLAPQRAAALFAERMATQTDVSDVATAMATGRPGFVLLDSRSADAWAKGFIPGALHLPTDDIATRAAELLDPAVPVVTYCWSPGCNSSTRAAHALAIQGYAVKEMIGGIEYWTREGHPLHTP